MASTNRRGASFIIRIWWEYGERDPPVWRGRVIHAQTRTAAAFGGLPALAAFLEQWTGISLPLASAATTNPQPTETQSSPNSKRSLP